MLLPSALLTPTFGLQHPNDESLDALAYSVAWYVAQASVQHYAPADQALPRAVIPSLVSSRAAQFDDVLRFCRSMMHGLHGLLVSESIVPRLQHAGIVQPSEEMTSYVALKLLVEASVDVVAMFVTPSTQQVVLPSQSTAAPPSKSCAPPPLVPSALSSPVNMGGEGTTPSSKVPAAASPMSSPSFRTQKEMRSAEVNVPPSPPRSQGKSLSSSMDVAHLSHLLTPHTCVQLLACAYLDALVALTLTDVFGTQEPSSDDSASRAFFVMSVLVGLDPEELLERFLLYLRVAPYPIRRLWALDVTSLAPAPANTLERLAKLVETTYATTSRKLMMNRAVAGALLEAAGPSSPTSNAEVAQLWRYVA